MFVGNDQIYFQAIHGTAASVMIWMMDGRDCLSVVGLVMYLYHIERTTVFEAPQANKSKLKRGPLMDDQAAASPSRTHSAQPLPPLPPLISFLPFNLPVPYHSHISIHHRTSPFLALFFPDFFFSLVSQSGPTTHDACASPTLPSRPRTGPRYVSHPNFMTGVVRPLRFIFFPRLVE
jgi:hypothetical protein